MSDKPPTEPEMVSVAIAIDALNKNGDEKRYVMRMGIYDQREDRFLDTKIETLLAIDPDEQLRMLS